MRQSQSKSLKSLFGTFVAHGNPRARSGVGQSPLRPASKLDTTLNAIGTTLLLAKDVGELASQVPYVKAVAAVLSQIIKIRDEIQANKERCDEIIDLVQLKSTTILQSLDTLYRANGADGFEDLKSDLEAYTELSSFLQAVVRDELEPFKTQSRWISYVNRGKNASDLQKLERQLDEFRDRFSAKRLVAISVDTRNAFTLLSKPIISQALPPPPKLFIGRESVVESVVQAILSSPEPRIVILGLGGNGKTTLATTVLHDARITSAYPTKYFVSSELSLTAELLEIRIANALSIPQNERETDLVSRIVDNIRRSANPVLLYIDNLETVWEVESEQPKIDQLLELLSGASSKLAVLVTMRGTQGPKTSFSWHSTVLLGLDPPNSIAMYEKLSGRPADASARELLLKLSGSPLAIKLFALMVTEGDSPSHLLSSWNESGAKVLEIGGQHRLSSLEQSIRLSVFSPRIDDTARLVLGLISLIPDGLSVSQPWFGLFESALPDVTLLQSTLRALRRAALLDKTGEPSRWQMLPPIRQFCFQLVDSTFPAVVSLVESRYDPDTWRALLPEMANVRGLLIYGSNMLPLPPFIGKAMADYVYGSCQRDIDESAILSTFLSLPIPDNQRAYMYHSLGIVHSRWSRLDSAEASFASALALCIKVEDRLGEAKTRLTIGDLHVRRYRLEAAETSFIGAQEAFLEVQDRLGEARTHKSIGYLHMRRYRPEAAELSFTQALKLYSEVQDRVGEAKTHLSLAHLHIRQDRPEAAAAASACALELFREVQYRMGEAETRLFIGDLLLRQDRLDAAELSFIRALDLYREFQHRLGEAHTQLSIGGLHVGRNQLEAAQSSFTCALELYGEIQDRTGEAKAQLLLGDLQLRQDQFDAAARSFSCALRLWSEISSPLGEANIHLSIGNLYVRQGQLDAADTSLNCALKLYCKIQDRMGEAVACKSIGGLHLRRDRLEPADASFTRALELYREMRNQWGIAYCIFFKGRICLLRQDLNEALLGFAQALIIWEDITNNWWIAETHRALGELYLQLDQLDEAERSLHLALNIYTSCLESDKEEALANRFIGEVYLRRGQFDDCERVFRRALDLDIATDNQAGQAQSYKALGRMFMKKGELV
ncbi:hypothetical protein DL96DRAFT_1560110 [Flagelloscypha sp. PMI_526]|nr:hypothetical protein DL96DRAFT_1560110 [Flagelloscypha sp. PMI_526]